MVFLLHVNFFFSFKAVLNLPSIPMDREGFVDEEFIVIITLLVSVFWKLILQILKVMGVVNSWNLRILTIYVSTVLSIINFA